MKKKYAILQVNLNDVKKFKEIAKILQLTNVSLFHKIVVMLDKRLQKKGTE